MFCHVFVVVVCNSAYLFSCSDEVSVSSQGMNHGSDSPTAFQSVIQSGSFEGLVLLWHLLFGLGDTVVQSPVR